MGERIRGIVHAISLLYCYGFAASTLGIVVKNGLELKEKFAGISEIFEVELVKKFS